MTNRRLPLRSVRPGESAQKGSRRRGVSAAAAGGDRRELLVALRDRVARSVEDLNTPARDLAALSRRLLEIAKEIEAIMAADGEGDEIGQAAATPDEEWSDI